MSRRAQGARAREVLLDAAAQEFWLHGLGGARIQSIMDRAGVTKGGLYHHFDGKAEIARALAEQEALAWPAMIDEVIASGTRGLACLERLCAAILERLDGQVRARAVLRMAEELDTPAGTSLFVLWQDAVIRVLQQAIADREVPDSIAIREVALTVVECVYGVAVSPAPMSRAVPAAARMDRLWSLLGSGLGLPG